MLFVCHILIFDKKSKDPFQCSPFILIQHESQAGKQSPWLLNNVKQCNSQLSNTGMVFLSIWIKQSKWHIPFKVLSKGIRVWIFLMNNNTPSHSYNLFNIIWTVSIISQLYTMVITCNLSTIAALFFSVTVVLLK